MRKRIDKWVLLFLGNISVPLLGFKSKNEFFKGLQHAVAPLFLSQWMFSTYYLKPVESEVWFSYFNIVNLIENKDSGG